MNSMFDTLRELPLFQGMSTVELTTILEKVKLKFERYSPGEVVTKAGRTCRRLQIALKGEFVLSTVSHRHVYELSEFLQGPYIIELPSMFGIHTTYRSTITAISEVNVISIGKNALVNQLFKYDIFMLNYVNNLSRLAQIAPIPLWDTPGQSVEGCIKKFILGRCFSREGKKVLSITDTDLAMNLHISAADVANTLKRMQARQVLYREDDKIIIPDVTMLA